MHSIRVPPQLPNIETSVVKTDMNAVRRAATHMLIRYDVMGETLVGRSNYYEMRKPWVGPTAIWIHICIEWPFKDTRH